MNQFFIINLITIIIFIFRYKNNMEVQLLQPSRSEIQKHIGLEDNHKLLILKTINGNSIFIKYFANHTRLIDIYKCLENDIKYNYFNGNDYIGNVDFTKHFSFKFNDKVISIDNIEKDLSELGILRNCEEIFLLIKNSYDNIDINDCLNRKEIVGSSNILIVTLTGKQFILEVPNDVKIKEIKLLIQDKNGNPPDQQRLINSGKQLPDDILLIDHLKNMNPDTIIKNLDYTIIHLVLRLRGGMFHEISGRNGNYKSLDKIINNIYYVDKFKYSI